MIFEPIPKRAEINLRKTVGILSRYAHSKGTRGRSHFHAYFNNKYA